ncbi:MAG: CRTAC1 family protein [Bacteroidota bacterium]
MKQVVPMLALYLCMYTPLISQGYLDQSITSGIGFAHEGQPDSVDMPVGGGSAWFDYNNDGHLDLYVCNRIGANKFFENNGNGTFNEIAAQLGIADALNDGAAVVVGDINNDGYQDLYLANSNHNVMFLNNQGNSFTNITASSGLSSIGEHRSTSGSFGDFNKDGYLDLYVTHHAGLMNTGIGDVRDYLFINNGDKTFTDVSTHLDTSIIKDPGFASSWTDFDKDGDQDLIVINDCPFPNFPNEGTFLFENQGGTDGVTDWQFSEVAAALLEDDCANGMGIGIGDYNRDGFMDLVYSNVGPARLFKNDNGSFVSQDTAGVSIHPFNHFSWGTSFMDYNNDGWMDIIMAVGSLGLAGGDLTQECNLFKNNGDETFTDIANTVGIDDTDRTRSIVHADYDNDGDLDLLMLNYDGQVRLLRNEEINGNGYLRVKLRSKKSAPDGIGSWIEVKTNDGVKQYFEMRTGSNLGGGDEIMAHFGLGTATMIDSIKVNWMSGAESILTNIGINTTLTIREPTPYIYVRKGATGDADGSDWANAYSEVSTALSMAVAGDTILVADGTYYPTNGLSEEVSFEIKNGIHLIGGFPATGGTFKERDLTGLNTILSGFIGPHNSGSTERSFHVVHIDESALTSSLDGFTIMEGEADGPLPVDKQGGGIYCEGKTQINNIKMISNTSESAGSSICTNGSAASITINNTVIIPPDHSVPVLSIDNNSEVIIEDSCEIQE